MEKGIPVRNSLFTGHLAVEARSPMIEKMNIGKSSGAYFDGGGAATAARITARASGSFRR